MFISCVYNETWWTMLNVNLNYKPPSSWKILFWSGGCPRQFSRLKIFRALTDPGGVCFKGTIIQERQMPSGLPAICKSLFRRKGDVIGESDHVLIQRNIPYRQMVRRLDSLSMRLDSTSILTWKSGGTNDAPGNPINVPNTSIILKQLSFY